MIWLKVAMAAILSGSLFALVESLLPPRVPEPLTVAVSEWAGDQVLRLITVLKAAPDELVLEIHPLADATHRADAFRDGRSTLFVGPVEALGGLGLEDLRIIHVFAAEVADPAATRFAPAQAVPHVLAVRAGVLADERTRLIQVIRGFDRVGAICRPAPATCWEALAASTGRAAAEWERAFATVRILDLPTSQSLLEGEATAPLVQRLPAAAAWIDSSLVREAAAP